MKIFVHGCLVLQSGLWQIAENNTDIKKTLCDSMHGCFSMTKLLVTAFKNLSPKQKNIVVKFDISETSQLNLLILPSKDFPISTTA